MVEQPACRLRAAIRRWPLQVFASMQICKDRAKIGFKPLRISFRGLSLKAPQTFQSSKCISILPFEMWLNNQRSFNMPFCNNSRQLLMPRLLNRQFSNSLILSGRAVSSGLLDCAVICLESKLISNYWKNSFCLGWAPKMPIADRWAGHRFVT